MWTISLFTLVSAAMDAVRDSLTTKPIPSLLWKYAFPAVLGMMLHAANALIDRYFIGITVGEIGNAALSVAFPIFTLLLALALWVSTGAATLISIKIGKKTDSEAVAVFKHGLILSCLALPLLGGLIWLALDPLTWLCGGRENLRLPVRDYLSPILFGYFFWSFATYISGSLRSFDRPKASLLIVSVSPLLNILLDYLFLVRMDMEMMGAGLATILSYVGASIVAGIVLARSKQLFNAATMPSEPDMPSEATLTRLRMILKFGLSVFLLQLCGAIFHAMINAQAERYGGIEALAILGVIFAVAGFIFMPVVGIGQGMQPIIGVNIAEQSTLHRVRETLRLAITWGTIVLTLSFILLMLKPAWVLTHFFSPDLLPEASSAATLSFILMPLIAFQIIIIHFFQAVGAPEKATYLVVLRQVFVLPFLLFLLPDWLGMGLTGVWLVSPVSDGVMFLITLALWLNYKPRIRSSEL